MSACAQAGTGIPAINPVTSPTLQPAITSSFPVPATVLPSDTPVPSFTPVPPCSPGLKFLSDVTIQDNTVVVPGSPLDKQWLVQNTGTCNWDSHYHLRLISGTEMGVQEQVLYPARAGAQATLQLLLNAPLETGWYSSTWQAVAPDGSSFGEVLTLTIIVQ